VSTISSPKKPEVAETPATPPQASSPPSTNGNSETPVTPAASDKVKSEDNTDASQQRRSQTLLSIDAITDALRQQADLDRKREMPDAHHGRSVEKSPPPAAPSGTPSGTPSNEDEPLPEGWVRRVDKRTGRKFYAK
jgi:hypothetical protein